MEKIFQKIIAPLFLLLLIILIIPFFHVYNYSQPVTTTPDNKVVYQLPYPGILPDHPLYFLKTTRDKVQAFLTRDNVKKAQLYLLYSDKRLAMAQALEKKGKTSLALSTLSKGEKYFLKIPPLLEQASEQGASPTAEFVDRVKTSNVKHKEVIGEMLQQIPQGSHEPLNEIMKITQSSEDQMRKLQK